MDIFLILFFGVMGFFVVIGILGSTFTASDRKKENEFKINFDKLLTEFLQEISNFKRDNEFNFSKSLRAGDNWYWLYNNKLCSVDFLGIIGETNTFHNNPKDYLLRELRSFGGVSPNFRPLEYAEFEKFKGIEIPIDKIVYFSEKGEVIQNTSVSGGGSSLGGAIVGGVLAGGVGAVIGSRKKVESETVTTDNREVILVYYEGEKLTKKKFSYKTLDVFDQLIPEKNYEFIQMQNTQKNKEKTNI
jgi:hypothetical protein